MPDTVIKDPKSLIVATGRLKLHATLPAVTPDKTVGYELDIGEHDWTVKATGDIKELWGALNGKLGKYKKKRVKPTLSYETDLAFLPPKLLGWWMGTAEAGGVPSPGKVLEFYGWMGLNMEDEAVFNDLGIFVHHSFLAAVTLDGDFDAKGEDFGKLKLTVDVLLGRAPGATSYAARPVAQV